MRITNRQAYNKIKKKTQNNRVHQDIGRKSFVSSIESLIRGSRSVCILQNGSAAKSFVRAFNFVRSEYPDVDISGVSAYILPYDEMDKVEQLKVCGGCYVPDIKTILIKDGKGDYVAKDKVNNLLKNYTLKSSHQDVLVHELFHAVSHALDRKTRLFSHLEEEFVYKSTIKWFKNNGLSDEEIVTSNFLPFAVQDIISQQKMDILLKICPNIKTESIDNARNIIEEHAEEFVEEVIDRAKTLARRMIDSDKLCVAPTAKEEEIFLDLD